MKTSPKMSILFVLLAGCVLCFADETSESLAIKTLLERSASLMATAGSSSNRKNLVLPTGKVLKHAYILSRKPNGITIAYDDGVQFFRFSEMPESFQRLFNYDAKKCKAFEKEVSEAEAKAAAEEAKRKEKEAIAMKKAEERHNEKQIFEQRQKIKKYELELAEMERRASTMERHIEQNRRDKVNLAGLGGRSISVWGGGLIRRNRPGSGQVAAAINDARRENSELQPRSENVRQDIISQKNKLEAAKLSLEMMLKNEKQLFFFTPGKTGFMNFL